MSNVLKSMIAVAAVAGLTLTVGCEKKPEDKAKAAVTKPAEGAKDAAKDGADKAKDAVKDGADKAKEAAPK